MLTSVVLELDPLTINMPTMTQCAKFEGTGNTGPMRIEVSKAMRVQVLRDISTSSAPSERVAHLQEEVI